MLKCALKLRESEGSCNIVETDHFHRLQIILLMPKHIFVVCIFLFLLFEISWILQG